MLVKALLRQYDIAARLAGLADLPVAKLQLRRRSLGKIRCRTYGSAFLEAHEPQRVGRATLGTAGRVKRRDRHHAVRRDMFEQVAPGIEQGRCHFFAKSLGLAVFIAQRLDLGQSKLRRLPAERFTWLKVIVDRRRHHALIAAGYLCDQ
ncbi:hypothetical protein D3C73_847080 [compost metagenome]